MTTSTCSLGLWLKAKLLVQYKDALSKANLTSLLFRDSAIETVFKYQKMADESKFDPNCNHLPVCFDQYIAG